MTRLQELTQKDVPIKELLEIEKELTRVRGEIEKLEGDQRWLLDRVEYASVNLTIVREGGESDFAASARFRTGPRVATLVLLDGDTMTSPRVGGGASVQLARQLTFDLDIFARTGAESRAVVATLGAAFYSSYLGGGRRRALNPFVGLRAGYGYLADAHAMTVGAEVGLELYKHRYLHVEAAARALAFIQKEDSTAALHGALGLTIPF